MVLSRFKQAPSTEFSVQTPDMRLVVQSHGPMLLQTARYRGQHVPMSPALVIGNSHEDRLHVADQLRVMADALEYGLTADEAPACGNCGEVGYACTCDVHAERHAAQDAMRGQR